MDIDELGFMTIPEIRCRILSGRENAASVAEYFLERAQRYGGSGCLNAVRELDLELAEKASALPESAKALPLYGIPVLFKDNIDVRGMLTTAGSAALCDNIADDDAEITANLRKSGALIMGKTNMTEFANYVSGNMPSGFSSMAGQVRHEYDMKSDPSGSSSGSAVGVAAGLCPAAIGTDTSFSVIGCATVHGLAALKPAAGELSQRGIVPLSPLLDSAGVFAHSFSDAVSVYSAMRSAPLGELPAIPISSLRLAVNHFNKGIVSAAQKKLYGALLTRLKRAGAKISRYDLAYTPLQRTVMQAEFERGVNAYLSESNAKMKTLKEIIDFYDSDPKKYIPYGADYLRAALGAGESLKAEYENALCERAKMRAELIPRLCEYDAVLMTGPTNIMHFLGLPSVALPLCEGGDALPRGLILYGANEKRLLAAAFEIEKYTKRTAPPTAFLSI